MVLKNIARTIRWLQNWHDREGIKTVLKRFINQSFFRCFILADFLVEHKRWEIIATYK